MQEFFTDAVVLHREPSGDLDNRFSLFTKKFGKIVAKGKSTRKILSKLSGHLEPGNVVQARVIELGGLQLVDALKDAAIPVSHMDLEKLHLLLAEHEPDPELWTALTSKTFNWPDVLRILGWDPKDAVCGICGRPPVSFQIRNQEFFCKACTSKLPADAVLYMYETA